MVGSAACSAEVDDFGFTAFDVITLFVAFNVWLAEDDSVDIIAVLALLLYLPTLKEAFALCDEDNDGVCDTNVEKATAVAICDVCLPVVVRPGSKFVVDDVLFISEPVVEPNKFVCFKRSRMHVQ